MHWMDYDATNGNKILPVSGFTGSGIEAAWKAMEDYKLNMSVSWDGKSETSKVL